MHPAIAAVLERVAALENREPSALPPLSDTVDPEALASLLESNGEVSVCFEYDGYRVVIGPGPHEVAVIDGER